MDIQKLPVRCKKGHESAAEIPIQCDMRITTTAMRVLRCPICRSKLFIVTGEDGDRILKAAREKAKS